MKKLMIATLALALVGLAANSHACGNHAKTDASSSKAEMNSGNSCESPSANATAQNNSRITTQQASGGKAKVMTTEYRRAVDSKGSGKVCPMTGVSCANEGAKASSSSMKADAGSTTTGEPATDKKDSSPTVLMGVISSDVVNQR